MRRFFASCIVFSLLILSASSVRAAPMRIDSSGCPSREELGRALLSLLPDATFSDDANNVVTIAPLPDAYRVEVGGQSRIFVDAKHECQERALTSAVFVAFVLDPPKPPPAKPVAAPRPLTRPRIELEVAALLALAPSGPVLTGGGAARLFVGSRWLGGVVGVSALSPGTLAVGTTRPREQRVPIDVGLRGHYERGRFGLNGDLELVVTPVVLQSAGVDIGGRAALAVQWRRWPKVAPFLGVELVAESRHDLLISGATAGTTPIVWLGFSLGIDLRLF